MWIIDIESSGLHKNSYPIQIGLTDGNRGQLFMLKPADHWTYWDDNAESIHKIPRASLKTCGLDPRHVALEMNKAFRNQTLYCDNPQWDSYWLKVLFSDSYLQPKFKIENNQSLFESNYSKLSVYEELRYFLYHSKIFTPHNALDDAIAIYHSIKIALDNNWDSSKREIYDLNLIFERWGINYSQAASILGISIFKLRCILIQNQSIDISLKLRITILIGIYNQLCRYDYDYDMQRGFINHTKTKTLFRNMTPLAHMIEYGLKGMYEIFRYLSLNPPQNSIISYY